MGVKNISTTYFKQSQYRGQVATRNVETKSWLGASFNVTGFIETWQNFGPLRAKNYIIYTIENSFL